MWVSSVETLHCNVSTVSFNRIKIKIMEGKFKNAYRIDSARLKNWNYASGGYYFVTICTEAKIKFFGRVQKFEMCLSDTGKIAEKFWCEIPKHFVGVNLDAFVIMPNHVHGIIVIDDWRDVMQRKMWYNGVDNVAVVSRDVAMQRLYERKTNYNGEHPEMSAISPVPRSLATIIRSYKSACSYEIHHSLNPYFRRQSSFHDHVIRDKVSYDKIRWYVANNPLLWDKDKLYIE